MEVNGGKQLIKEKDKDLICQCVMDDECSQLWEFPGGKLEADETLEECIAREIDEELRLAIEVIDVFAETIYHFRELVVHFTSFHCIITGGELVLNVHHDAAWVMASELQKYTFMPTGVVIDEKLLRES